uniref:ATPase family protein n=1 Tax=Megaviridae environmental sample TaxID=1737588 RepID=A0A5J6VKC5_9VIRU|nr:MAG: ATPase family protein [Megaviridae environmental sample]
MEQPIDNQISNEWVTHVNDVNIKVHNMWNFLVYNKFVDDKYNDIYRKYILLKNDNYHIKNKYDNLKNQVRESKNDNSRKRNITKLSTNEWYDNEIEECPAKRIKMSKKRINSELIDVFSKMDNINEIIKLEDYKYKYNLLSNSKFRKLFRIIPSLRKLNNIIGMDTVKDQIFKIICYFIHGLNNSTDLNHIVISGDPGVGKTTLSKILGEIYLNLGFLRNNNFVQAKRSDLIAKYLGQTSHKTQEVIDSAEGGILFIDEVYSLGNNEGKDSYAKECIDTINLNLTEKSDKFLCIVAGYKDDIDKCFFAFNKGLERRFTIKFHIDNYSPNELLEIFKTFVKNDNWSLEENSINIDDIELVKDNIKYNGGDMQKLFQKAKEFYSLRVMKTSTDIVLKDKLLVREDVCKALEMFKSKKEDEYYLCTMYS